MWFSQGCTIGCKECNFSAPTTIYYGDCCPNYHEGNKTPTITDPRLTTWNAQEMRGNVSFTRLHPWRRPGSVPGGDPCGLAGGSNSNKSYPAGGFGPETGYPQGFPGSKLPPIDKDKRATWTAGKSAEVSWVSAANHGGGYMYSLCPASEELTEECFNKMPLQYVNNSRQQLRYIYVNDTSNKTETTIIATRVTEGVYPQGATWTKNPVPSGSFIGGFPGGNGQGNLHPPQFEPPEGCDEHCWGYQPCNYGWTHPSWEGWNRTHPSLPTCAPKNGEGCCHTSAYVAIVDEVVVPQVPPGDYVVRWRWDAEQSPQIWSGCGDVTIA